LDRTQVIPTYKGPLHIFTYNYIFHVPASNNVFMLFNATLQLYREYPEKTIDLSKVTEILLHNVVSSTPHHEQDSNSL